MSTLKTDYLGNTKGNEASGTYVTCGPIRIYGFNTAITANTTAATGADGAAAPAGSIAFTSHATGIGKVFRSDGTLWQFAAVA